MCEWMYPNGKTDREQDLYVNMMSRAMERIESVEMLDYMIANTKGNGYVLPKSPSEIPGYKPWTFLETPDLYKPIMFDVVGNGLDRSASVLHPITTME